MRVTARALAALLTASIFGIVASDNAASESRRWCVPRAPSASTTRIHPPTNGTRSPSPSLLPSSLSFPDYAACTVPDAATPGAIAMRAELDAMEEVLAGAKSALRDLERLVDAQTLKLRTMRALSADPDVSCDESVVAASRLAETLARSTAPARRHVHRARRDTLDDDDDEDHLSASSDHHSSFPDRLSSSSSPTGLIPSSRRVGDARAVAKRRDVWPEHLRLFAATRLDADPTAVAMMPQRGEDDFPRYFVAGDAIGRVHVLRPDGDLAVLSDSATGSAVTSVTCALARKNETVIVSGHAERTIAFPRVRDGPILRRSRRGWWWMIYTRSSRRFT